MVVRVGVVGVGVLGVELLAVRAVGHPSLHCTRITQEFARFSRRVTTTNFMEEYPFLRDTFSLWRITYVCPKNYHINIITKLQTTSYNHKICASK